MKRPMTLLFVMAFLLGTNQSLNATLIHFEDTECVELGEQVIRDQYRDRGLIFDGVTTLSGRVFVIGSYGTANFGNSDPCIMHIGDVGHTTTAIFVIPGTDTPTVANDITIRMGDGHIDLDTFTVICYDEDDNEVRRRDLQTTDNGIDVRFKRCAYITFTLSSVHSGVALDDFCFNDPFRCCFDDPSGCCSATQGGSTLGVTPVYSSADLAKHLTYFLLPLGALIGLAIWRRKK